MANVVDPQMPGNQPQPQQSGGGKGCLWGCLLVGGLFVASILCAGVGLYWFASSTIEKYTSDTPVELPTVEYSDEKLTELETRVESFKEKLDAGETPEQDLILSAEDINALIAQNEDLKGRVYVKIENNQVEGDVSVPLDAIPMGKGRYFNGSATFDVSMEDGFLVVTAQQAEVNGEPVPEEFMQALRQENLAKDVYKDPENRKFIQQFEDIRIEDNQFVLRVKRDRDAGDQEQSGTVQDNPLLEGDNGEASSETSGNSEGEATEANPEAAQEAEPAATDSETVPQ